MDKLYIVMPAYNEQDNIENIVKEWHPVIESIGNGSKLVIVNDGSKDNTYQILSELTAKYPCLEPVNKKNSGHGPTCLYAYDYVVKQGADFVFQTDSDGQTLAEEFWPFWEKRHEHDFIIGVRHNREDGFSRIVVTRTLRMLVWLLFGTYVNDANTPFRLMNTTILKEYLERIPSDFFLSNVLLSVLAVKRKENVKWLDITFRPRQAGENSINIKRIIRIGLKSISTFREFIKNNKEFLTAQKS